MKQPRRYLVRKLHDVDGLNQREIAEKLGISAATVNRDLAETVAPAGRTPLGAPYYPPGRFDEDPDFKVRCHELMRSMPAQVAKRQAAREFAGPPRIGDVSGLRKNIRQVTSLCRSRSGRRCS